MDSPDSATHSDGHYLSTTCPPSRFLTIIFGGHWALRTKDLICDEEKGHVVAQRVFFHHAGHDCCWVHRYRKLKGSGQGALCAGTLFGATRSGACSHWVESRKPADGFSSGPIQRCQGSACRKFAGGES